MPNLILVRASMPVGRDESEFVLGHLRDGEDILGRWQNGSSSSITHVYEYSGRIGAARTRLACLPTIC